jgi:rubrerythrin
VSLLIIAVVTILTVGFVLLPFLRPRTGVRAELEPTTRDGLVATREALYREMEDLRLERELGSVDEEEYERRVGECRLQAAGTLRDQERLEEQLSGLEEAVASARAGLHADGASTCHACGAPADPAAERCPSCGAAPATDDAPAEEGTDR